MRALTLGLLGAAAMASAGPALAHHSFAMFDTKRTVTLNGTIKEFQWTNPHSWIEVSVVNDKGGVDEWSIECGSPNMLSRNGWRPAILKPGDKVVVITNPMKDGSTGGALVKITLPDGRMFASPGGVPVPAGDKS
jgi:hypothetical protein